MNEKSSIEKIREKHLYKLTVVIILMVLVLFTFLVSVSLGAFKLPLKGVIKAIFIENEGISRNIIWKIRVPRSLVAASVGTCLSLSGGILQGVMRNPLASPNIIGVSSGAGLAATITLVLFPAYEYLLTPSAFIGAFLTTLIIYFLSWQNGLKPLRMVLSGIAVSSFVSAIINTILIFYPDRVQNTLGFTIGSLAAKTWSDFHLLWPYALIGFILTMIMSRRLNILNLGDEIARSLGLNIERNRMIFIILASLLAASAVSIVGMLGFVGLLVPHITRMIIGSDYRYLFPASALLGASLIMICDTVARIILDPMELPVGIIMSILGAPFFLYLLRGGLKNHAKNK
ncbi:MAG: iron ABC transporter permease [Bacillota bacterium]|nr:iron ABC transporter permease [Bacillota bacterium]